MSKSTDRKQFWDERSQTASSDFELDHGTRPGLELERLSERALLSFVNPQPNQSVFDAGCGTGGNILLLHSRVKYIVGMDYSAGTVTRCRNRIQSKGIKNVDVIEGSITQTPLSNDSIDTVLCTSVLQYLNDSELRCALSEFVRILKDGGSLVLHVKNLSSLYLSTLWLVKRLKLLLRRHTKLEYYRSFSWYARTLKTFGFEIVDYNSFNLFMLDIFHPRLISYLEKLELRNYNKGLFGTGFMRRRGYDLNIKARLRKESVQSGGCDR